LLSLGLVSNSLTITLTKRRRRGSTSRSFLVEAQWKASGIRSHPAASI